MLYPVPLSHLDVPNVTSDGLKMRCHDVTFVGNAYCPLVPSIWTYGPNLRAGKTRLGV